MSPYKYTGDLTMFSSISNNALFFGLNFYIEVEMLTFSFYNFLNYYPPL